MVLFIFQLNGVEECTPLAPLALLALIEMGILWCAAFPATAAAYKRVASLVVVFPLLRCEFRRQEMFLAGRTR